VVRALAPPLVTQATKARASIRAAQSHGCPILRSSKEAKESNSSKHVKTNQFIILVVNYESLLSTERLIWALATRAKQGQVGVVGSCFVEEVLDPLIIAGFIRQRLTHIWVLLVGPFPESLRYASTTSRAASLPDRQPLSGCACAGWATRKKRAITPAFRMAFSAMESAG